jgi:hypothetical protein
VPDEPVNSLDSAIQIYEDYLQSAQSKQQRLAESKRDEGGMTRHSPESPPSETKEDSPVSTSFNHAFYHLLDNDIGCA